LRCANFRYQSIAASLLPLQITEPVSSGKCRNIFSYKSEWAFRYQFLAAGIELDKPHILALAAETVFCDLKSKFPIILKLKYQRFNGNGRPLD
jgi:hypothetical protein